MQELSAKKMNDVLKSDKLTLVEFWAPWCGWCRRLAPILEEMESTYKDKIVFTTLNTENYPEISGKYGVMSLPNMVFFCGGRPVAELIGYLPPEKLKQEFDKVLSKYKDCYNQSSQMK